MVSVQVLIFMCLLVIAIMLFISFMIAKQMEKTAIGKSKKTATLFMIMGFGNSKRLEKMKVVRHKNGLIYDNQVENVDGQVYVTPKGAFRKKLPQPFPENELLEWFGNWYYPKSVAIREIGMQQTAELDNLMYYKNQVAILQQQLSSIQNDEYRVVEQAAESAKKMQEATMLGYIVAQGRNSNSGGKK